MLYEQLMHLCETNEAFYFNDHETGEVGYVHRIFNYRLASYSDFLQPGALECRGIMYLIGAGAGDACTGEGHVCVSRPPEKFFNFEENPFTLFDGGFDEMYEQLAFVMPKSDGSLISTYIDVFGNIKLKSKASLTSEQALAAMEWLKLAKGRYADGVRYAVEVLVRCGHTVNMEWTSPDNRIVLGYSEPKLIVLNARDNITGEYMDLYTLSKITGGYNLSVHPQALIGYRDQQDIEGYVVRLKDGRHIKFKTDWYCIRHHTKDSVNNPYRLFAACLADATDDIKQLFERDTEALKRIEDMEVLTFNSHNHLITVVEAFFAENHTLTRKEYAIKGQEELTKLYFGLAMVLYSGRIPSYKEALLKNWKLFVEVG